MTTLPLIFVGNIEHHSLIREVWQGISMKISINILFQVKHININI